MIAIIGGVKRCEKEYKELLEKENIKCKFYNTICPNFKKKIENCECCVVFVNTVSHKMVRACNEVCKKNNIKIHHITNTNKDALKNCIC